jgi:1,4-alpha-glucan branching enzyme
MAVSNGGGRTRARKTSRTPAVRAKKVTVRYTAPGALHVALAGEFNGWSTDAEPMTRGRGGVWSAVLVLPPGTYQYKFLVDGEWREDDTNPKRVVVDHGVVNSVLEVA